MGVGIKIRRLREERKMSQDELADLLGIAQTTISNIESDKTTPDFLLMDKVCRIFDKDFDYFLEEKITINNHIEKAEGSNVGFYHNDQINMLTPDSLLKKIILYQVHKIKYKTRRKTAPFYSIIICHSE